MKTFEDIRAVVSQISLAVDHVETFLSNDDPKDRQYIEETYQAAVLCLSEIHGFTVEETKQKLIDEGLINGNN